MFEKLKALSKRKPFPWYGIIGIDLMIMVAILLIFSLFHHVIPKKGQALGSTMPDTMPTYVPAPTASSPSASSPLSQSTPPVSTSVSPTAYPVGDFSATFPTEDTGSGALYSYQSDDLRIAITKGYGESSVYFWADVWVRNIQVYRTAFAQNQYGTGIVEWPLDIATSQNAVFAVTGDYFGARNEGLVIRNGTLYRNSINSDVCLLLADGTMETYTAEGFDLSTQLTRGVWQGWAFGPELMRDGQAISEFTSSISGANPRCAIGYFEPGHYCFVLVDGRQENYSNGMTFNELSKLFYNRGCKAAFNLDGGQTAAMIFQGNIVNIPCEGGRRLSDIICFSGGAQ